MSQLEGKSALVTGASRGIGEAVSRELAKQGVKVLLAARSIKAIENIAREIDADSGSAKAVACDVSQYEQVQNAVDSCIGSFGSINILVNNAGVIEPISLLADSDPEQWCTASDINYKGVYFGMRAAIPHMLSQRSGVIVNISSGAAVSALEGWSHYCSSKAAALSLTKCGDKEYRELGIRVVGLSPGTVATEMQVSIRASGINPVSRLDPSVHIPPEWVGRAVVWLCTEDAADVAGTDLSLRSDDVKRRIGLI